MIVVNTPFWFRSSIWYGAGEYQDNVPFRYDGWGMSHCTVQDGPVTNPGISFWCSLPPGLGPVLPPQ
jgi:hypothetical protein